MSSRPVVWRVFRAALLAAVMGAALGHAAGIWPLRFVTALDTALADARLRAFMPRTLDARIVIVDIDEKSLAQVGRWPWGRDHLAALTNELFDRQRAAVVGFDLLFAEPDTGTGLPELERLAADAPELAARLGRWRVELDHDATFARALDGRAAVLGVYLTNDRDAHRVGVLPAPVFDASALQGRTVAATHWDGYAANLAVLARAAPIAGFFNAVTDADGQVRSVPLIAEFGGRYFEPLSLAMFRVHTGAPRVLPGFVPSSSLLTRLQNGLPEALPKDRPRSRQALDSIVLEQGASRLSLPVESLARARVPFRGPGGPHGGSYEYVSAVDLLNHHVAPGHLAGKLVLVGTTAPGAYDQRATPVAEVYPGTEVHANLLSGLLDGRLPVVPDWAAGFEIAQLLLICAALAAGLPRLRPGQAAQLALVLVLLMAAVNLWAYAAHRVLLPLAASLLLTALLYGGITLRAFVIEGRQRRSLARLFGSYVPPELVTEMARDPARYDMRAENRVLTVMFCDMRNFTRVSEQMSPEDLRALMNRFFSDMTAVIREHRGTLDKYIGDAIMAFWGAPVADRAHAANAVQAALAMGERLGGLNAELARRGLPPIGVGIGLNTGLVCVGDMGSSMRRSYTVMGDAVNLASRIEALTRHYGVEVLAGQATRDEACDEAPDELPNRARAEAPGGRASGTVWVEVDRVRVKGKSRDVTLFTPVPAALAGIPTFHDEMRLWQLALASHRLQHWGEAQAHLQQLKSGCADSPLAGLYRQLDQRIAHYRIAPPPADWDGAHTFDSK